MANKPLEIAGKLKSTTKGAADWYFGGGNEAWDTLADAIAGVPQAIRSGKTVGILVGGKIVKYIWHPSDITDNGLVIEADLSTKADLNGNNTERFKVADAISSDEAATKGQLDQAIVNANTALSPKGNWNANTNTPDISSETVTGSYWIISVAGTTNIGGINDWGVNDWVIKTDGGWAKIDNTDKVVSVAGKTGNVTLNFADITDFNTGVNSVVSGTYALISQLFSGNYNDLSNKPDLSVYALINQLFSGNYNDLTNKPNLFSGSYTDLTSKPDLTQYALINQLFSGSYTDLTNTPDLSKLLTDVDDAFYLDANNVLRPNLTSSTKSIVYTGGSKIFDLVFYTTKIWLVFRNGKKLQPINYKFTHPSTIEILSTLNVDDEVDILFHHFVNAPI
jgi:hypothetical protein